MLIHFKTILGLNVTTVEHKVITGAFAFGYILKCTLVAMGQKGYNENKKGLQITGAIFIYFSPDSVFSITVLELASKLQNQHIHEPSKTTMLIIYTATTTFTRCELSSV